MGTITNSIFLHRSARTTRQNAEHARPSPEPARGANGSGPPLTRCVPFGNNKETVFPLTNRK
jgi:hypothetical protein